MKSIFIFTILFFFGVSLQVVAQCSNTFPMATGSLTPPGVGQSTSVKYGAGQYVLAYCQAGASYTVTTCGTFAIIGYDEFGDPIYDGFDSQLTVYAADGSLLAYNDDFCGLQSQASFTSSKCQFVRIVLTQYYCNGSGLQMTVKMTQNTAPSLPSTPAVTPTAPICNNTKATLTATCSDNLKWYDASGANLQFSGSPFVTPNLLENTTYKVRCENATTACVSDFAEVVVTVKPANKTVYVNKLNTSGTYDGNNWTTAFSNLQDALAASCAGYQIWVAAGTYKPDEGAGYTLGNRNHSFSMKNGVSILGGFPNDGSGTLTNRNWAANPTILSGDIDNDATLANNSYTVVTSLEVGNSAVLNGFTITGGYANEPYNDNTNPSNSGGGMYNQRSSPVIMNCIFSKNTVSYEGGGMYNDDSYPIITNCFFFKNSATVGVGGGMRNQNGASPVLTNCTFSGNIATNGGGMFNGLQSSPSLTNCIFWGNSSEILNNFNNFTINRSIIQGGYTPCNNCPNGNGNTNPLFVDANGGNLRLQPCSPAINAGDPTTTSATVGNLDLANNPRFFNDGTVDIGAYEFQGNAITQPSASASTTTAVICSGNTINLSASGGGSFSWAGPSGSNFSSTDQNPSFMGSSTSYSGLYSVSVSNANCPVTATATVSVKVNQGLNNPQVSPVAPLCSGASLLFSASGGSSYSWAGPANFSSALQNPSRSTATITMAGTYSVTVSAGAGCASVLTVSVQIYAAVTALSKSSNSPVCQGNTLQLSASGGSFYSWRAPDGFTSTEQNPARPSASAGMSGLYSVTVGNGGTCTVSATLSVSVQAAALSVNPNPLNVCIGQTINLSANASPAASAFSWKGPGNFSSTTQNISTYATTTANLGIYSVSATIGSCTVSASSEVKSGAVLQAGVVGIPCLGGTIQFTASGMTSYTWSRPTNNFNSNLPNPVIPSSSLNDAGIYFLSARSGACVTSTLVSVLIAGSGINPSFSVNPSTIAAGATVALSAASASGVYSWSGPSGFSGNTRTKTITNFQAANNGTYSLTLTVGTCTGYSEKNISINSATRLAAAETEPMEMEINAYPNPVTHTLTVEVRLKEPSALQLNLVNSVGKVSGAWQLEEISTFHKTELNLSALQGGVYLLQAQAGRQKVVKRVVKIQY